VKSLSNKNRDLSEILKILMRTSYLANFLAFRGAFVVFRNLRLQKTFGKTSTVLLMSFGESEDGKTIAVSLSDVRQHQLNGPSIGNSPRPTAHYFHKIGGLKC
jgi:hypothetical protein